MTRRILIAALAIAAVSTPAAIAQTSHEGWPKINGQLWINKHDKSTSKHGAAKNDKLLGGHGSDQLYGEGGKDVLGGDYKASGQGTAQHDLCGCGPWSNLASASHGVNDIQGGARAYITPSH